MEIGGSTGMKLWKEWGGAQDILAKISFFGESYSWLRAKILACAHKIPDVCTVLG